MDEITLHWEDPFTGAELHKNIIGAHPDDLVKTKYSSLIHPRVYVFHDEKQVLYVGQANKSKGSPLRGRLKEHVNNETTFSKRLRDNNIEVCDLSVIVTPFNEQSDYRLGKISLIENTIMCPCKPPGHLDENLRIINLSNHRPLPKIIDITF